jgi:hypothetical protein
MGGEQSQRIPEPPKQSEGPRGSSTTKDTRDATRPEPAPTPLADQDSWVLFGKRLKITDALMVVFTFFLVIVSALQMRILDRTDRATKQSADAATKAANVAEDTLIATQRPWVSVELSVAGPLTFTDEEARVEIGFLLKNTGNSPAINVQVEAEIALFMGDVSGAPHEIMKQICKRAKASPDDNAVLGHTIFPNDQFPYRVNLGKRRDQIREALRNFGEKNNDWFAPAVVGCVSYRFAFQPGRHTTEFYADLRKVDRDNPKVPLTFKMSDGNVSANQMVLLRSFIGGNAD